VLSVAIVNAMNLLTILFAAPLFAASPPFRTCQVTLIVTLTICTIAASRQILTDGTKDTIFSTT